jgi:uncharacterized protein (DUF1697 family)
VSAFVALLRAVNVGGNNMIAMADVRARAETLGLEDARTILQSGNLVFRASKKTPAQIEKMLASAYGVDVFVRSLEDWKKLIAQNPFGSFAKDNPSRLLVVALDRAPAAAAMKTLEAAIVGSERVKAKGTQLYVAYPDGMGKSKLSNVVVEKKLGVRGTGRNWNTVLKLAALAEEIEGERRPSIKK